MLQEVTFCFKMLSKHIMTILPSVMEALQYTEAYLQVLPDKWQMKINLNVCFSTVLKILKSKESVSCWGDRLPSWASINCFFTNKAWS